MQEGQGVWTRLGRRKRRPAARAQAPRRRCQGSCPTRPGIGRRSHQPLAPLPRPRGASECSGTQRFLFGRPGRAWRGAPAPAPAASGCWRSRADRRGARKTAPRVCASSFPARCRSGGAGTSGEPCRAVRVQLGCWRVPRAWQSCSRRPAPFGAGALQLPLASTPRARPCTHLPPPRRRALASASASCRAPRAGTRGARCPSSGARAPCGALRRRCPWGACDRG